MYNLTERQRTNRESGIIYLVETRESRERERENEIVKQSHLSPRISARREGDRSINEFVARLSDDSAVMLKQYLQELVPSRLRNFASTVHVGLYSQKQWFVVVVVVVDVVVASSAFVTLLCSRSVAVMVRKKDDCVDFSFIS